MVFQLQATITPAVFFKIFYFITKANGLLPITVTFNPTRASHSFIDILYSALYSITLIVCIPCVQSTIITFIGLLHNSKLTIILVFLIQVLCSALRIVAIYLSQVFNHKTLARFINRSVEINKMLTNGKKQNSFLDTKLSKWCLSKFISTIFQVICMLVPARQLVLFQ